jgi:hypothetical protein
MLDAVHRWLAARAPTHIRSTGHKVIHRFIYGQFGQSENKSVFDFQTDCPNCPSVDDVATGGLGAMGHLGSLGSRFSVALKYAYCEPFSIRKLFQLFSKHTTQIAQG